MGGKAMLLVLTLAYVCFLPSSICLVTVPSQSPSTDTTQIPDTSVSPPPSQSPVVEEGVIDEGVVQLAREMGKSLQEVAEMRKIIGEIEDIERQIHGRESASTQKSGIESLTFGGDMILEVAVLRDILADLKEQMSLRRKRSYINFTRYPLSKWSIHPAIPISYTFYEYGAQPVFTAEEKRLIKLSMAHWAERTCVSFDEVPYRHNNMSYNHYLRFVKVSSGCQSETGLRSPGIPNNIYLASTCLNTMGVMVHEIGHTFGILHEHARYDRDDHVTVMEDNIISGALPQFRKWSAIDNNLYNKPYDYDSVMHYPAHAFSNNGQVTLEARDPAMQYTMGQRTGTSVLDVQGFNDVYCKGACVGSVPACNNGGVQNTRTCNTCVCPTGFTGSFCENLEPSSNAECGGEMKLPSGGEHLIASPGAGNDATYPYNTSCTWRYKASPGQRLRLTFYDSFGVMCSTARDCIQHWVEIKFRDDKTQPGARYCCYHHSGASIVSEGHDMMVLWRAHPFLTHTRSRRNDNFGWRAVVTAEPETGQTVGPQLPLTATPPPATLPSPPPSSSATSSATTSTSATCGWCQRTPATGLSERACSQQITATCIGHTRNSVTSFDRSIYPCSRTQDFCCQDAFLHSQSDGNVLCHVADWSHWEEWSSCSRKCGGCGVQTRKRSGYGVVWQSESRPCSKQVCDVTSRPDFCLQAPHLQLCNRVMPECCPHYTTSGDVCLYVTDSPEVPLTS